MSPFNPAQIRALVFDVFGTVVDWRSSIIEEGQALSKVKAKENSLPEIDWPAFADAWRAGYVPAMTKATAPAADGSTPWASIDVLHREILESLLPSFGLESLTEDERVDLNLVWHRLNPWPDSVRGLRKLKARYVISTLSNGNVSLLVNMAKHARLPWDCVLSSELARQYKPHPAVYQMAARLLGLGPAQVLMVAAHPGDLRAAQKAGMRTAYVTRPFEYGPNPNGTPPPDAQDDDAFDIVASDFIDLAQQLEKGLEKRMEKRA
jgi:2-haloacid dehalogenase